MKPDARGALREAGSPVAGTHGEESGRSSEAPPRPSGPDSARARALAAGRELFAWALAVCLVMALKGNNALMAGSVLAVVFGRGLAWGAKGDAALFLVGFVCGSAIETAGTALGVWSYAQPSFLNLPLWLPPAWGLSAVVLFRIGQALTGSGSDHSKDLGGNEIG